LAIKKVKFSHRIAPFYGSGNFAVCKKFELVAELQGIDVADRGKFLLLV